MSEFGKGLTYCLGMFLAHSGNRIEPRLWFNGASDHLYEMQIPDSLPERLKDRLKAFRDLSLDFGHGRGLIDVQVTKKDVQWALSEAMDLLLEIDKFYGIEVEEAEWE